MKLQPDSSYGDHPSFLARSFNTDSFMILHNFLVSLIKWFCIYLDVMTDTYLKYLIDICNDTPTTTITSQSEFLMLTKLSQTECKTNEIQSFLKPL